jgi:probable addiction module antidote protein
LASYPKDERPAAVTTRVQSFVTYLILGGRAGKPGYVPNYANYVPLGDIARARGMAEVAKATGLGRESLYKALAPGARPRFDTVLKVARALEVRLSARAA